MLRILDLQYKQCTSVDVLQAGLELNAIWLVKIHYDR